ncbi:MAG: FeoB-associated Cys-rich membrane protein [Candidatus Nealsonbacteria bacterium]|nr:FeoB-associated Cys-rich membrane protein [Candidatus Nealsonbacteria bacterium]
MNLDWQTVTALALIAVATVYVIRRGRRALSGKRSGSCGTCSQCATSSDREQIVSIDPSPK